MLTGADWKRIAAAADERLLLLLLLLLPPLLGHAREEAKPGRFCFGRGCKGRWDDQLAASSAHVKSVLLDAPAFEDASDAACVLLAIRKECLGELDGRSVLRPGKVREREAAVGTLAGPAAVAGRACDESPRTRSGLDEDAIGRQLSRSNPSARPSSRRGMAGEARRRAP
jgi:hypothetical protein